MGWYWFLWWLLWSFISHHKGLYNCILNSLGFEFHSSSYQHMTTLGHRNVRCLRCFWYLECGLHRNWVADMFPTILWSPAYACAVPYCSGWFRSIFIFASYYSLFCYVSILFILCRMCIHQYQKDCRLRLLIFSGNVSKRFSILKLFEDFNLYFLSYMV